MSLQTPGSDPTREQVGRLILLAVAWVFVIALLPNRYWPWQGISAVVLVWLTRLLHVPPRDLLRRWAALLPFVALIAAGQLVHPDWPVRVANLAIKAGLSLWVMMLLVVKRPFPQLLHGLRGLGLPVLMVELLAFWQRYAHVLTEEWDRMRLARTARTLAHSRRREFGLLARSLGLLLVRSYERAERVHQAMLARGYRGPR